MNDPNAPNPDSARRDRSPRDEASTRHARQAPTVSRDEDRGGYVYFSRIATRWIDNDVYGHVNNAVYYQFFDTVANAYLMEHAGLDIECSATVAFVVASSCRYHAPLRHPAALDVGFRVNRIGRSSVEYGVAVFEAGSDVAAADGTFTHVFVDREGGRSVPIPPAVRAALEAARYAPSVER